jgi:hypothetical protein
MWKWIKQKVKNLELRLLNKSQLKEYLDGRKEWYLNGKLHREDGPAVEYPTGNKCWCKNGELHREDGPAIEHADGTKEWYLNGERHREDGPAYERADGYKEWLREGLLHREDGPAVEGLNGNKEWWLNGEWFHDDYEVSGLRGNYIVIERGIPTDRMFGNIKLTVTRLMTAERMLGVYDNLPGIDILD